MRRFFVESIQDDQVFIAGTDARHIGKVLRFKAGDRVAVVAGGKEYEVVLTEIGPNGVKGKVMEGRPGSADPALPVMLVQGLPKGDKIELIIQKCTELGITEIWPVYTERSVVRLNPQKAEERRKRWQRIAGEAAKQCQRQRIPVIKDIQSWAGVLQSLPEGMQGILLWEKEDNNTLREALLNMDCARPVYIFVGPEGGLTEDEVSLARRQGVLPVTLGPRILRTETAGLAALSIVMYQLGDLGGGGMTCKG